VSTKPTERFHPDRLRKLEELEAAGVDAYPVASPEARRPTAEVRAEVEALDVPPGERSEAEAVVAGRVMARRGFGKLAFLDVEDQSGRLQVCVQKGAVPAEDFALLERLDLGDQVAACGVLGRTKVGEPTLFATGFTLLAKSLLPPPEKFHGLTDPELRARRRYVDLFANPEVREAFLKRADLVQAVRSTLLDHRYVEVETPVLHPIYGGAFARPFVTRHHALDMELYLRIAPELYLKRLLVGGIERVFEFARVFRNEGLSPRHNPEFTMLEFYEAYGDVRTMMDRTEEVVVAAADAVGLERDSEGRRVARFRGADYVLEPPFPRVRWADAFRERVGVDPTDRDAVRPLLERAGIEAAGDEGLPWWKAVNDLFEAEVEPHLAGPVFVTDYPAAICPLAKPTPGDPTWAERFEFFLGGMELANAFSELNDPRLQLARFEEQVASRDPEAPSAIDWDYVRALAYGMPPAGGCGLGVDRLAMVLLGRDNIREVLLFPHLRPE